MEGKEGMSEKLPEREYTETWPTSDDCTCVRMRNDRRQEELRKLAIADAVLWAEENGVSVLHCPDYQTFEATTGGGTAAEADSYEASINSLRSKMWPDTTAAAITNLRAKLEPDMTESSKLMRDKTDEHDDKDKPDKRGLTLRELQTHLPWTIRYSRDYRANPQAHKDLTHALLHAGKALGKLMALADDMDHDREVADDPGLRKRYAKYVADLVVCALRASNVFPGGVIDLESAVVDRIETKNGVEL